jgi:acetyl-CoA carboxylase biotin carboxylase subunit
MATALRRVLVANRGEIAVRIVRACHDEGCEAIVVVSDADRESLPASIADGVVDIGRPSPAASYLRVEQVVAAALLAGCDAVHPGYGFLSERPELAEACTDHGLVFVGPPADIIRRAGDKLQARAAAAAGCVPIGVGSAAVRSPVAAAGAADKLGYPVVLKAAAGGGGRGIVLVRDERELRERFHAASAEAEAAFGDGRLYVERFVERARHVEVQLLADAHGSILHLGERDCSLQRRYQKLIEEAPARVLSPGMREQIAAAAVSLGRALGYVNAGTVEFLVDLEQEEFSFLEINTRIQVEHPVTEMVTGVDIVRAQLRVAGGEPLHLAQEDVVVAGHAIECRINAEAPADGFRPSPGRIDRVAWPTGPHVRIDTHAFEGYVVPPEYDSLLAKLVVHGRDRAAAIDELDAALEQLTVTGIDTNVDMHRRVVGHPDFRADRLHTRWLERTFLPGFERALSGSR